MSSEEKLTLTPISSIPDGNGKPVVEEGMNEIETFYGLIETTADALKVIELCRQGKLGRVRRRLHDKERKMIRSGSVFVFDETESGVKRWTDGRLWSPSRILGNFLIYRELERKTLDASSWEAESAVPQPENELNDFDLAIFSGSEELEGLLPWLSDPIVNSELRDPTGIGSEMEILKSKKLLNNHKGRYIFKPNGLIKKTISIRIDDHPHHLVCYYNRKDFCQGHLGGGSTFNSSLMQEMRHVIIPPELLSQQSFRKPAGLTIGSELGSTEGTGVVIECPEQLQEPSSVKRHNSRRRNSYPGGLAPNLQSISLQQYCAYAPIAPAPLYSSSLSISESFLNPSFEASDDLIMPTLETFPYKQNLQVKRQFEGSRDEDELHSSRRIKQISEVIVQQLSRAKWDEDNDNDHNKFNHSIWKEWPSSDLFPTDDHNGYHEGNEILLQKDPMLPSMPNTSP